MKTGVILLAHRPDDSIRPVAEWYAERLEEKGHKDVHLAYQIGDPNVKDVLKMMNVHGQNNTFVVIPLLLFEGDISVWRMPGQMDMPDNSCSFTYSTGTHIAIRFTTTFDRSDALSETILERLEEAGAEKDDGILVISHGSRLSMQSKAVDKHIDYISGKGYSNIQKAVMRYDGPSIGESIQKLIDNGAKRIVVVPLFLFEGKSVKETIPGIISALHLDVPVICTETIGRSYRLLEEMSGKIPKGW